MRKKIDIDGMMCKGCSGRIDKLLNAIPGVSAQVSLDDKNAIVDITGDVEDAVLVDTIDGAGYKVVQITEI